MQKRKGRLKFSFQTTFFLLALFEHWIEDWFIANNLTQTRLSFSQSRIRVCHQFPVYVFADIDFRGIKMEAVKFLLQPLVVAFDDF